MELISLKIENFGSVGSMALPLNKPGLILVTGINKDAANVDSNGSGKSTIFEAICWCLWGDTVRGLTGDEVVNTSAGKDCAVALTLVEHGTNYVVSRHRLDTRTKKPNDLLVFANGKALGTSGKMKTMQDVVNQLVGFDFHTFRAMMPGAGIKVANMTDKAIKELLESLLQTEQLSAAHDAAKTKLKTLEAAIASQKGRIAQCQHQLDAYQVDITNLRTLMAQMETNKKRIREGHELRIKALEEEIAQLGAQLADEQSLINEHADYRTKANKIEQDTRSVYLEPLKTFLRLKDERIQEHQTELALLKNQHVGLTCDLHQADSLGAECANCFQQVPKEHVAAVKEELAKEAADILEQITEATCAIGVLRKEKQDKERETMVIVRENEERVKQLRFAESVLQDKINRLVTVKSLHSRAVADLGREQALLQKLETEESNEAHDFSKLIAQKEELVKKTEDTIANHQTVMDQAAQEAKLCSFWVNGFSPSGLRSFMLDYVTPILNDRAKYYSELLTNGEMTVTFSTKSTLKSGTEKDKFSITCQQAHGSASYRGSSAGERARADLVIAMALGDLAQFRTTKQLPWRFLDEPFESIDRSGTEAIVKLLNDQKSRYKTVFVVTHKPDFKEMFSQQITIVKENGKSTLYEEADRQRSKQDSKAPGS